MTWLLCLGVCLAVLALAAVGLTAFGERRWAGGMKALHAQLEAGRLDGKPGASPLPTRYDMRELEGLPAPVQRYFRAVLKDGQAIITAVNIDMAGSFNLSPTGEQWKPFTSHQRAVTRRPGFLWDAKISMLPGAKVHVVDSYVVGHGLLHAAIQGLFTMADIQGEGEIARGEFMRWFAEVAWYPPRCCPTRVCAGRRSTTTQPRPPSPMACLR